MAVPLTTIFTPTAPWCSNILYTFSREWNGHSWFKKDILGPGEGTTSECYPPSYSSVYTFLAAVPMYSPGVCPSGYRAVLQLDGNGNPDGVTTAVCCPSYFTSALQRGCESTVSTPTTATLLLNPDTTITTVTTYVAAAFPINIAWASSDLDLFTPKSAPLGLDLVPSTTSSTTSHTQTQTTSTAEVVPTNVHGSLSSGAKAGISVGVAIAILVAIFVGMWLFVHWKRKRGSTDARQQSYPEVQVSSAHIQQQKQVAPQSTNAPVQQILEVEGSPVLCK